MNRSYASVLTRRRPAWYIPRAAAAVALLAATCSPTYVISAMLLLAPFVCVIVA